MGGEGFVVEPHARGIENNDIGLVLTPVEVLRLRFIKFDADAIELCVHASVLNRFGHELDADDARSAAVVAVGDCRRPPDRMTSRQNDSVGLAVIRAGNSES